MHLDLASSRINVLHLNNAQLLILWDVLDGFSARAEVDTHPEEWPQLSDLMDRVQRLLGDAESAQ